LWPPLSAHTRVRVLHHARQTEHAVLATPVAAGAHLDRTAVRSNHSAHRPENLAAVSRSAAPHSLLRRRKGTAADLSHQQFLASGFHHHRIVPSALANRAVLPLDQAAPAYQELLPHFRE